MTRNPADPVVTLAHLLTTSSDPATTAALETAMMRVAPTSQDGVRAQLALAARRVEQIRQPSEPEPLLDDIECALRHAIAYMQPSLTTSFEVD